MTSEETLLQSINEKLDMMIKLLSLDVAKGRTFSEQVKLLNQIGMSPIEIATCLGKTSNNVRVALYEVRKKGKMKKYG